MWQAVLFNHAKSGYLEMPGKGGQDELSDEAWKRRRNTCWA
jgi:cytochrome c5